MSQNDISGISPMLAAHYPTRMADGRTIVRSDLPGTVVLTEDGKVELRRDDEPPSRPDSLQAFMARPIASLTPSTCVICNTPITVLQPGDGPVLHGDGVAHESCSNTLIDNTLAEHPPRGHRPRSRS